MATITLTPDECKEIFKQLESISYKSLNTMKLIVTILDKIDKGAKSQTGFTLTI